MFKLHKYSCKKCIPALIIILFFIGLLPPNLYGQVKIKERVELQNSKGVESFIWPVNGCEYDRHEIWPYFIKFEPNPVSPGHATVATIWIDEEFNWIYWPDSADYLQRIIELEPDYGEVTRIGLAEYLITIPDTVTSDSVAIVFNYSNYTDGCSGWGKSEKSTQITQCPTCNPPELWRTLYEDFATDTLVIKPDSFVVYIEPEECYPGDTVQVVIKKRLSDGTLVDFPATQTYEIAKLEGCMLGNILADNDSGSYFYDVSQPIYFAAADTLVGDTTGTVMLQVGLVDPAKKKELPINHPTHSESNDCFTGPFLSVSEKKKSFNVYDPIIISWDPGKYDITPEPKMPTLLTIWIQPREFVGLYQIVWALEVKWTSTEQTPDKVFSYTFLNTKTASTPDGTDLPVPEGDETIVGGDDITLTGIYYDSKYPYGYPFTKKLTGMKILGKNGDNNVQVVNGYIAGHQFDPIDLPLIEPITLQDQRKQMQIIVEKESSHFQFFDTRYTYKRHGPNDIGYPNTQRNTGGAADWGLCQLNKWEPSLGIIWNWKENINAGIDFLWGEKYDILKSLYNNIKKKYAKKGITIRGLTKEEFLLWHTQLYRRGSYYVDYTEGNPRKNEPSKFVKTDIKKYYEYGDDFLSRFNQ